MIEANLETGMDRIKTHMHTVQSTSIFVKLIETIEAFWDAGDAVKRRKTANKIFRDLVNERISGARAVSELRTLNKRQKGGWLVAQLHALRIRFAKRRSHNS
jgi:hypothetical protein